MSPEFRPVRTRRTFEEAVAQIADRIHVGDLHPGDRLPPERALAEQMEISRPTVREAIRTLADAGVVAVSPGPGGGTEVASSTVPRDLVRSSARMRVGEVAGVLEARRMLEPRVAQLAALYATEDDFEAMAVTIERQRELAADPHFLRHEDRFLQLDFQFHLGVARATGNATVVQLMRTLLRRLEIARDMVVHLPLVPDWSVEIHERTLAAIRGGEEGEIEAVMDEHLAKMETTWERETGRALVRPLPNFLRPLAER